MKNRITGETKSIEKGFNLWVFLFGWIYLLIKGDNLKAVLLLFSGAIFLAFTGWQIAAILMGIINALAAWNWYKHYIEILKKKDYEIIEQKIE